MKILKGEEQPVVMVPTQYRRKLHRPWWRRLLALRGEVVKRHTAYQMTFSVEVREAA